MKIVQIAFLAITLTTGFAVNAQESTESRKTTDKKLSTVNNANIQKLSLTPEQTALNKTNELKSKMELTNDQEVAVKNLFLKIENRKAGLTNLNEADKQRSLNELQSVEDRELNSILAPTQQKINSESKTTTKTATNM